MTTASQRPLIERVDSDMEGPGAPLNWFRAAGGKAAEEEYDTFAGLVFGLLGYIPDDGSTPELEEFGLVIRSPRSRTTSWKRPWYTLNNNLKAKILKAYNEKQQAPYRRGVLLW